MQRGAVGRTDPAAYNKCRWINDSNLTGYTSTLGRRHRRGHLMIRLHRSPSEEELADLLPLRAGSLVRRGNRAHPVIRDPGSASQRSKLLAPRGRLRQACRRPCESPLRRQSNARMPRGEAGVPVDTRTTMADAEVTGTVARSGARSPSFLGARSCRGQRHDDRSHEPHQRPRLRRLRAPPDGFPIENCFGAVAAAGGAGCPSGVHFGTARRVSIVSGGRATISPRELAFDSSPQHRRAQPPSPPNRATYASWSRGANRAAVVRHCIAKRQPLTSARSAPTVARR